MQRGQPQALGAINWKLITGRLSSVDTAARALKITSSMTGKDWRQATLNWSSDLLIFAPITIVIQRVCRKLAIY